VGKSSIFIPSRRVKMVLEKSSDKSIFVALMEYGNERDMANGLRHSSDLSRGEMVKLQIFRYLAVDITEKSA